MKNRYTADEMREMALVEESYGWDVVAKMLRQGADAIERESTSEKSSQVGNAAKMREAQGGMVMISQPHRGARMKAETTEAKDPTQCALRKG